MSRVLVLDAEALSALASKTGARADEVRTAMEAARRLGRDVVVPAVVLAELYRGPRHDQLVDACLSRNIGIVVRDTDRGMARLVGSVLSNAGLGSAELVDAHCVAAAVEAGGGVVLTGDADDLERLSSHYRNVMITVI